MKYTIQDLADGKVVLQYDFLHLEKLRKVLNLAFPGCNIIEGNGKFYFRSTYAKNGWISTNNFYLLNLPVQKLEDFVLPKEKEEIINSSEILNRLEEISISLHDAKEHNDVLIRKMKDFKRFQDQQIDH